MNKKRIAQYCCAALVATGIGLNVQNAIADYGIDENSLSLVADPSSNSGSNSNSNSNDISGSHSGYETYDLTGGFFSPKSRFWYCPEHRVREGYNPRDICVD